MNEEIEKRIIEKANEIALEKAIKIVEKQFADVTCTAAKFRTLSIKNDIMDGVRLCITIVRENDTVQQDLNIRDHLNLINNHGYKGKIGILKNNVNGILGIPCAKKDQVVLYRTYEINEKDDMDTMRWNQNHCTIEFPYSEEVIQSRAAYNNCINTYGTCVGVPLSMIQELVY